MSGNGILDLIPRETLQRWAEEDVGKDPELDDFLGDPNKTAEDCYQDRVAHAQKILRRVHARQALGIEPDIDHPVEAAQMELNARERDLEVAARVQTFVNFQRYLVDRSQGKKSTVHRKVSDETWYELEIRWHELSYLCPNSDKKARMAKLTLEFPDLVIDDKTLNNRLKDPGNLPYTFSPEVFQANKSNKKS